MPNPGSQTATLQSVMRGPLHWTQLLTVFLAPVLTTSPLKSLHGLQLKVSVLISVPWLHVGCFPSG